MKLLRKRRGKVGMEQDGLGYQRFGASVGPSKAKPGEKKPFLLLESIEPRGNIPLTRGYECLCQQG